jgi:O-antigen ligase
VNNKVVDSRSTVREFLIALPASLLLAILPYPHTVALRLSCVATSFLAALLIWRKVRPAVPPVPCGKAIGVWALISCASLVYAVDPSNSWREIQNETVYTILVFWSFYVLGHSGRFLPHLMAGLALGASGIALWAVFLFVKAGSLHELNLVIGAAGLVTYIVTVAPVVLLAWLWPSKFIHSASLVVLLLLVAAAVACQQRIAWPILSLQAVAAAIYAGFRWRARISLSIYGLIVAFILAAGTILYYQADRARHNDAGIERIVGDQRLLRIWGPVAEKIAGSPLVGAGFGRHAMRKAYPDLIPEDNPMLWHAHNVILNYGLALGVPGMVAIVLLFLCLGQKHGGLLFLRDDRLNIIGLVGLLVVTGVLLRNQVNDMFVRDNALLFWALNGMLLGIASSIRSAGEQRPAASR